MRRHEVICKAPIAPESRPGALIFAVAGRPASRRMADPAPYARTRYDSVAYAGTVRSDRFPPCRGWKAGPAPGLAMAPSVRGTSGSARIPQARGAAGPRGSHRQGRRR
jgi:hypothetical protein